MCWYRGLRSKVEEDSSKGALDDTHQQLQRPDLCDSPQVTMAREPQGPSARDQT